MNETSNANNKKSGGFFQSFRKRKRRMNNNKQLSNDDSQEDPDHSTSSTSSSPRQRRFSNSSHNSSSSSLISLFSNGGGSSRKSKNNNKANSPDDTDNDLPPESAVMEREEAPISTRKRSKKKKNRRTLKDTAVTSKNSSRGSGEDTSSMTISGRFRLAEQEIDQRLESFRFHDKTNEDALRAHSPLPSSSNSSSSSRKMVMSQQQQPQLQPPLSATSMRSVTSIDTTLPYHHLSDLQQQLAQAEQHFLQDIVASAEAVVDADAASTASSGQVLLASSASASSLAASDASPVPTVPQERWPQGEASSTALSRTRSRPVSLAHDHQEERQKQETLPQHLAMPQPDSLEPPPQATAEARHASFLPKEATQAQEPPTPLSQEPPPQAIPRPEPITPPPPTSITSEHPPKSIPTQVPHDDASSNHSSGIPATTHALAALEAAVALSAVLDPNEFVQQQQQQQQDHQAQPQRSPVLSFLPSVSIPPSLPLPPGPADGYVVVPSSALRASTGEKLQEYHRQLDRTKERVRRLKRTRSTGSSSSCGSSGGDLLSYDEGTALEVMETDDFRGSPPVEMDPAVEVSHVGDDEGLNAFNESRETPLGDTLLVPMPLLLPKQADLPEGDDKGCATAEIVADNDEARQGESEKVELSGDATTSLSKATSEPTKEEGGAASDGAMLPEHSAENGANANGSALVEAFSDHDAGQHDQGTDPHHESAAASTTPPAEQLARLRHPHASESKDQSQLGAANLRQDDQDFDPEPAGAATNTGVPQEQEELHREPSLPQEASPSVLANALNEERFASWFGEDGDERAVANSNVDDYSEEYLSDLSSVGYGSVGLFGGGSGVGAMDDHQQQPAAAAVVAKERHPCWFGIPLANNNNANDDDSLTENQSVFGDSASMFGDQIDSDIMVVDQDESDKVLSEMRVLEQTVFAEDDDEYAAGDENGMTGHQILADNTPVEHEVVFAAGDNDKSESTSSSEEDYALGAVAKAIAGATTVAETIWDDVLLVAAAAVALEGEEEVEEAEEKEKGGNSLAETTRSVMVKDDLKQHDMGGESVTATGHEDSIAGNSNIRDEDHTDKVDGDRSSNPGNKMMLDQSFTEHDDDEDDANIGLCLDDDEEECDGSGFSYNPQDGDPAALTVSPAAYAAPPPSTALKNEDDQNAPPPTVTDVSAFSETESEDESGSQKGGEDEEESESQDDDECSDHKGTEEGQGVESPPAKTVVRPILKRPRSITRSYSGGITPMETIHEGEPVLMPAPPLGRSGSWIELDQQQQRRQQHQRLWRDKAGALDHDYDYDSDYYDPHQKNSPRFYNVAVLFIMVLFFWGMGMYYSHVLDFHYHHGGNHTRYRSSYSNSPSPSQFQRSQKHNNAPREQPQHHRHYVNFNPVPTLPQHNKRMAHVPVPSTAKKEKKYSVSQSSPSSSPVLSPQRQQPQLQRKQHQREQHHVEREQAQQEPQLHHKHYVHYNPFPARRRHRKTASAGVSNSNSKHNHSKNNSMPAGTAAAATETARPMAQWKCRIPFSFLVSASCRKRASTNAIFNSDDFFVTDVMMQ